MFFPQLSCFFDDPADVGNLISCSSAFSKTSLNIWKFTVHVLLKPGLENFEHSFTSLWDECNCVVVWAFFGIAFLRDWNENWPFPVLWLKKEFLGPELHLRPVHADRAGPPLQWTLSFVLSACGNHNRRVRPPLDRGTLKIISRLLIA